MAYCNKFRVNLYFRVLIFFFHFSNKHSHSICEGHWRTNLINIKFNWKFQSLKVRSSKKTSLSSIPSPFPSFLLSLILPYYYMLHIKFVFQKCVSWQSKNYLLMDDVQGTSTCWVPTWHIRSLCIRLGIYSVSDRGNSSFSESSNYFLGGYYTFNCALPKVQMFKS